MDTAIRVNNVGKLYRLGEMDRYLTIRESLTNAWSSMIGRQGNGAWTDGKSALQKHDQEIWALKDVSFDVKHGEVVGIIGRNGAGKSTLLKIISRITEPTEGEVELFGRVASLLEVGTGFHPELTGRENVYLNGSVLGMRKKEIDRKFDEIIDFSGVERFLDTPVKRYSTGMQVRLAFAVAAHLEPEILLIDEVLAVGDVEFQRKCLGKMDDVARSGRTVLFVSHNMAAVENLCGRGLQLEAGKLKRIGSINDVIEKYLSDNAEVTGEVDATEHPNRVSGARPVIQRFLILNAEGKTAGQIGLGEEVSFLLYLKTADPITGLMVGIHIYNWIGQRITSLHMDFQLNSTFDLTNTATIRCTVPQFDLIPGTYHIVADISAAHRIDRIDPIAHFEVLPRDIYGTGRIPPPSYGMVICRGQWTVDQQHLSDVNA